MEPFLWSGARSLKSGLVLPTQIFGLFGPPKKRVDADKMIDNCGTPPGDDGYDDGDDEDDGDDGDV